MKDSNEEWYGKRRSRERRREEKRKAKADKQTGNDIWWA